MATKQELEVENAELKTKLDELGSADPAAEHIMHLEAQVAGLLEDAKKGKDAANAEIGDLKAKLEVLRAEFDLPQAGPSGDHVVLKGVEHRILGIYEARWVNEAVTKRFLEEDRTCVVIDRHGA